MNGKNDNLHSKVSTFHLLAFLVLFLLALAACTPSPEVAPSTAAPLNTEDWSLNTATPTPTETSTPEKITLTGTFGLPPELADAFKGAEKYITRAQDGGYLVTAKFRNPETGELEAIDLELLPDTFSLNEDLKNPLAPLTVRAISLTPAPLPQGEGVEVRAEPTLVWTGAEFRLAPSLPAIYEAVNTDNPVFNPEAFAQIPRFTVEDIQSGLAVQSLLVDIQDRLVSGESLSDILYLDPEAVRQNWQKLGGNSLLFELLSDGTRIANLKAKGNDKNARQQRYDNLTMKFLPFSAQIEINGKNHFAFYIANFDPVDPENPDPNDLGNWKFFLSIPFGSQNPPESDWRPAFSKKNPYFPLPLLFATNPDLDPNDPENILIRPADPDNPDSLPLLLPRKSLLAQLLGIEGNDARIADDYDNLFERTINRRISQLSDSNNVIEVPLTGSDYHYPLPPQLQQMIFLFEVGVAQ